MSIIGIDLGTSNSADGQMLVGEPARRQATANPEGTVTAFKRKMGKRETIVLRGRDYSPEQLFAFLLQKIKRDAEAFLAERFQMSTGVDVRHDLKAARLMEAADNTSLGEFNLDGLPPAPRGQVVDAEYRENR